ncbi:uncharacterized protein FYW47_012040 [Aplochiton taeniatus]
MEDSEIELTSSEPDALGADFITVELDTQPIEYVVKWAEVGSKFTISCVKKEADEGSGLVPEQMKTESDVAFFSPYEDVYQSCEVSEQSVEVKTDSDYEEDNTEPGSSLLDEDGADDSGSDNEDYDPMTQYRCNYCGKSYSHASSLYRHQLTHSGKVPPLPPSKQAVAIKGKKHQCNHCGMTFKGSRTLGTHLRTHGGTRVHPCNICGKEFNHSSSLSRHRLIHKKGKGGLSKDVRLPPNMSQNRRPMKGGARKGRRQRQQGGRQAARNEEMPASQGGEKFYACTQCEMTFRTSMMLSKHQVTHVKELLTNYTEGKENLGKTSSDLKIRLKLCSRDKPNFYTLCKKNRRRRKAGKRAAAAAAAAASTSEDEEGGQYGCELCGKRFSHASSLARHQATHKGGNKFSCSYCDKSFTRLSNLHHHEKSHSTGKTYECAACNKTFVHSSSYSRHKKAHMEQAGRVPKRGKRGKVDEMAPLETDSE